MKHEAFKEKDLSRLVRLFVTGSLAVLLLCLCGTALVLSILFLGKEKERAETSMKQLTHFLNLQYRPITEEMWTQNYEAISLRVSKIAEQIGRADYEMVLVDEKGTCVFNGGSDVAASDCKVPAILQEHISKFRPGLSPTPTLRFDEGSNRYLYMVPLYVGNLFKGHLYSAIADPYDFFREKPITLFLRLIFPVIICLVFIWLMWLFICRRFILKPYLSALVESEKKAALGELAAQVAHDIRSPIVALMTVANRSKTLPQNEALLLKSSASRIYSILDELLEKYREPKTISQNAFTLVSAVINSIVAEKTAMLGGRTAIEIRSNFESRALTIGVPISSIDLSRIFSNLINNAIDAIGDANSGEILLNVACRDGQVIIALTDNGCGIPREVMHKLQTIGGTYGKKHGAGIGLSHAKAILGRIHGNLIIDSEVERGTSVVMEIPVAETPSWCAQELTLGEEDKVVVLDDDEGVHSLWRAKLGDRNVVYLKDPEEFDLAVYPPKIFRYIFDHEISGCSVTGLDLIRAHSLGERALLVTSYFNDIKIQDGVRDSGAKILPKFLIDHISIGTPKAQKVTAMSVAQKADLVLIDDQQFIHDLWEYDAQLKGKKLVTVFTERDLADHNLEFSTPIFVDRHLAEGVSGLDVAHRLHQIGFRNISITTGDSVDSVPRIPFIRSVVGKEFPL